jgi:adenylylsulfate reductase subunit A
MSTVPGLFMAGDICGASGHKFSSGSHAEGRIAAKAAIAFILDNPDFKPTPRKTADEMAAELYMPYEIYEKNKTYSTAPAVNPHYIKPDMLQARLQKIGDEYFAGISTYYMTSKTMLEEGLKQLVLLKEDSAQMGASNLHELMRCWENYHRILSLETSISLMTISGKSSPAPRTTWKPVSSQCPRKNSCTFGLNNQVGSN